MCPEAKVTALDNVSGLVLVHGVDVGNCNKLGITLAPLVRNADQIRVSLLAVLSNGLGVVVGVALEERLGVAAVVDVDLGDGVVDFGILASFAHFGLQPG